VQKFPCGVDAVSELRYCKYPCQFLFFSSFDAVENWDISHLELNPVWNGSAQSLTKRFAFVNKERREIYQMDDPALLALHLPILLQETFRTRCANETSVRVHYQNNVLALLGQCAGCFLDSDCIFNRCGVEVLAGSRKLDSASLITMAVEQGDKIVEAGRAVPCSMDEHNGGLRDCHIGLRGEL
jgi:hypothetical protein